MMDTNLWGRRIVSQFIPRWMVKPNSKPERSMAMGLGDDGGDHDGDGGG
jgi:hypothetical protein